MENWEEEVKQALVAGEREFGSLDAHQTVRHSLVRRCEEILGEQPQLALVIEPSGALGEEERQ